MILNGDVIENLKELETGSVQCVVTSPPYWGLRDYGTAKWEGGDESCDHSVAKINPLKIDAQIAVHLKKTNNLDLNPLLKNM